MGVRGQEAMELPLVWWAGGDSLRGFLSNSRQVSDGWPQYEDQSIAGSAELVNGKLLLSGPSASSTGKEGYQGGPLLCG
jgi:hypothetical protein